MNTTTIKTKRMINKAVRGSEMWIIETEDLGEVAYFTNNKELMDNVGDPVELLKLLFQGQTISYELGSNATGYYFTNVKLISKQQAKPKTKSCSVLSSDQYARTWSNLFVNTSKSKKQEIRITETNNAMDELIKKIRELN
jgi:hypothetical protein